MAKLFYSDSCLVVEEGAYDTENDRMGRFVRVRFDGEQEPRRLTLEASLYGKCPVGEAVYLELTEVLRPKGVLRRDGTVGAIMVEKRKVVGFHSRLTLVEAA
jgi:hypothetical protein